MRSRSLQKIFISFLAATLALPLAPPARADEPLAPAAKVSYGAIVGLVTNPANAPVARATVTASRLDAAGIRATLTGSDGVYSFADLPAGKWTITVQVDGYPDVTVAALEVLASKATRRDLVMNASSPSSPTAPAIAPAPGLAPAPAVASAKGAAAAPRIPEALQEPEPGPENDTQTPWANVGYVGWMNGTSREKSPIFDTKFFTPEIRLDINYLQSLNRPSDHTIDGSTEEFRSGEFQIEQVSLGGDFHWDNVRARFLSMFGMFATTTPRNDASSQVGQWQLSDAYRYFSEANDELRGH